MKHLIYVCLSAYIFMCSGTIQTETTCLRPDVPENGNYTSEHEKLQPGDEITYSCNKGFALSGKERRLCKTSGQWSDHTPFCDPAAKLRIPYPGNSSLGERIIDGSTETCFTLSLWNYGQIRVPLDQKIIVRMVRIFFKRGPINIEIYTGTSRSMVLSSNHSSFHGSDQWIVFQYTVNLIVDVIIIEVTGERKSFTICEIEVYGKREEDCDQSPISKIENGYLEVSRSKAVLVCDDGFKIQRNSRLVCEENNTWNGGPLICEAKEKPKVNTEIITTEKPKVNKQIINYAVVGFVVVLITIALLAAIIFIVKKRQRRDRQVAVIYKSSAEGSVLSGSDVDSPAYYEIMDNTSGVPDPTPLRLPL